MQKYVAFVMLGILGGAVQAANDKSISFRGFLISVITACFTAIIITLFLYDTAMPLSVKGGIIGIGSWASAKTLEIVSDAYLRRLKKIVGIAEEIRRFEEAEAEEKKHENA